jgi:hypothetical protein
MEFNGERLGQFITGIRKRQIHNKIGEAMTAHFNNYNVEWSLISHNRKLDLTGYEHPNYYMVTYQCKIKWEHLDRDEIESYKTQIRGALAVFNMKHSRQFENAGIFSIDLKEVSSVVYGVQTTNLLVRFEIVGMNPNRLRLS